MQNLFRVTGNKQKMQDDLSLDFRTSHFCTKIIPSLWIPILSSRCSQYFSLRNFCAELANNNEKTRRFHNFHLNSRTSETDVYSWRANVFSCSHFFTILSSNFKCIKVSLKNDANKLERVWNHIVFMYWACIRFRWKKGRHQRKSCFKSRVNSKYS